MLPNGDPIPMLGNPNDTSLKEYIVTVKDHCHLDTLYSDMENHGGNDCIPSRAVAVVDRKPGSRNTHYLMSYDEAARLKNDPRVLDIELNPEDLGLKKGTFGFEQSSDFFSKKTESSWVDINWGLLRTLRKTDIPNWGQGGPLSAGQDTPIQSATIISDMSGKNVDVVVMDDGVPETTALEFFSNPDGTGYTRAVEYNWYQHKTSLGFIVNAPIDEYPYEAYRYNLHCQHTSGTCVGNTQGWARDSNLYNIRYDDSPLYVREFHKNKPINPLTGVKNPTIMNNSWGYSLGYVDTAHISKLHIRGVDYFPTSGSQGSYVWDDNIINNVAYLNTNGAFPARSSSTDADFIDVMNEGVVVVASAGNSYYYQDRLGGLDYDNYMIYNNTSYWLHRGSSPAAADGGSESTKVICVGAIGCHNYNPSYPTNPYAATAVQIGDYKAEFSNYGPRVDVFAPGSAIQSSISMAEFGEVRYDEFDVEDIRCYPTGYNDYFNKHMNNMHKMPGTSMSGPQVVGVLACLAEKYPRMNQTLARKLIANHSKETLLSTNGGAQDFKDAGLSFNAESCKKILFLQGTRMPEQEVGGYYATPYPTVTSLTRETSGVVYPRQKYTNSFNSKATFSVNTDHAVRANNQTATITINTTNVPDGTAIPYIISGLPYLKTTTRDTSLFSGVCNSSNTISGITLSTVSNTSTRIITTGANTGTSTTITNDLKGSNGLTEATNLTFGDNSGGYWTVSLPFNFTYANNTYDKVYVSTRGLITMGSGIADPVYPNQFNASYPPVDKIVIAADLRHGTRIFYGTAGSSPNRQFRIRFEGHIYNVYTSGMGPKTQHPTVVYELVFFENAPTQIDVHMGVNYLNVPSVDEIPTNNPYNYFDYSFINVPLTGNVIINSGTATLPITFNPSRAYDMNFRLGIYPTPSVNILHTE